MSILKKRLDRLSHAVIGEDDKLVTIRDSNGAIAFEGTSAEFREVLKAVDGKTRTK